MSNEQITAALGKPFPREAIKTRQGGGGRSFQYVEGHTVIHQLIDATNNTWSLEVREITSLQLGSKTLLQARVALTIPGLGTREHIGVQAIDERGGEDLVKGVVTDALKKAATLFGVGLELYGPDYGAGEVWRDDVSGFGYDMPPVHNAPVTRSQASRRDEPRTRASSGQRTEQEARPRQVQFITALAREIGMSEEELRAESSQRFSRDVGALNRRDASIFIEELTKRRPNAAGVSVSQMTADKTVNYGPPDPPEPDDYEEVAMFNAAHADRFTN